MNNITPLMKLMLFERTECDLLAIIVDHRE